MLIEHNHFKQYRKQSQLTQEDIAFVSGLSHAANISRLEQSHRTPKVDTLISYHLLFGVPIEMFFDRHKRMLTNEVINRISSRLEQLKGMASEPGIEERKTFLNSALIRLTTQVI